MLIFFMNYLNPSSLSIGAKLRLDHESTMDQLPPPDGDTNVGPRTLGIVLAMFATSLFFFVPRIYTHSVKGKKLKTPDYIVSLAVVSVLVKCLGRHSRGRETKQLILLQLLEIPVLALLGAAVKEGFGRNNYYISPEERTDILRYVFCVGMMGIWVSSIARVSIASLLLQLETSPPWRVTLYAAASLQIVVALCANVAQLTDCRPIYAKWEHVPDAICWTPEMSRAYYYFPIGKCATDWQSKGLLLNLVGASGISDLAFAIMPVLLIRKLNRPLLERTVVGILMALSLCGMATVIARAVLKAASDRTGDNRRQIHLQIIMCRLEDCALIAASCAPFLKGPIEQFIRSRLDLPKFHYLPRGLRSIHVITGHFTGTDSTTERRGDTWHKESQIPRESRISPSSSQIGP
jgi:hypothetical protein